MEVAQLRAEIGELQARIAAHGTAAEQEPSTPCTPQGLPACGSTGHMQSFNHSIAAADSPIIPTVVLLPLHMHDAHTSLHTYLHSCLYSGRAEQRAPLRASQSCAWTRVWTCLSTCTQACCTQATSASGPMPLSVRVFLHMSAHISVHRPSAKDFQVRAGHA